MAAAIRGAATVTALCLTMSGGSCAHRQTEIDRIELRSEDRNRLASLALAFVASIRAGDTLQAKRLTVGGNALKSFVEEDSVLVWSDAVMRPSSQQPAYLYGDRAEVDLVFISAPAPSRCPYDRNETIRTFVFRRRGGGWLIEKVILPFC